MRWLITLSALLAFGAAAQPAPVVASGTVPDEAARAAILARLREVYGAARVLDQLTVGGVAAPPQWSAHVLALLGTDLRPVSHGQLKVDGTAVAVRGEVASEAQRRQIAAELAARLDGGYTVTNGLRVAVREQAVLDAALGKRIVEFDSGQATLTAAGRAILDEIGAALLRLKERRVEVIGHTDNVGARAQNLALSQARADAVRTYLAGKGLDPTQIAATGLGPDQPVADNGNPAGRARNRRIEFRLVR